MYLKSIDIHGFKSFANRTVFEFLPDGVAERSATAIVGPNGSGKSNVADAIRWVLGEQKMRHLRSKKSEDVIFAGSDARGKMSMASVTITIDNSDGTLPIEYDELAITRKLYRTGESEYLINGKTVRLLDLQLLLAKAQFGQGSYAVIGQGMIDQLLLQSPVERKSFFDEAFGIKEFQIKRHQASLKLAKTKEHTTQADALLHEVAPRLKSLARQVKKLEERQHIERELVHAEETYYVTLFLHNKSELDTLYTGIQEVERSYRKGQDRLESIQRELAELARADSRQEIYRGLQREHAAAVSEKNALESARATLSGKMQVEYSKAGRQDIGWIENKVSSLAGDEEKLTADMEEGGREINREEKRLQELRHDLETLSLERTELRTKLSNLENQLVQAKSEQNYFQFTGLRAVQAILEERHRFGRIYGAVAQLAEVKEQFQLALDVAAGGGLSSIVVEDDVVAKQCIEYLRTNQLGFATFFPLNKIKGRFLPQDIDHVISMNGVHGLAIELAYFDKRFYEIFSYIFGSTVIVDSIDVAREVGIGRVRMVTLDGDMLETSGSMKGGYRERRQSGLSFGKVQAPHMAGMALEERTRSMEGVKQELIDIDRKTREKEHDIRDRDADITLAKQKLAMLRERTREIHRERAALEQELSLSSMSEREYSAAMRDIGAEKRKLDLEIAHFNQTITDIEQRIQSFNEEEETKKRRIFALQDEMQQEQTEVNIRAEEKSDLQIRAAKIETRQEDLLNDAYQELKSSIDTMIKRGVMPIDHAGVEELSVRIQKLRYKRSLIGSIDEDVVSEYEETRERHEGLLTQLTDLEKAIKDLEKLIDELETLMKKRRTHAFRDIRKEFRRYFEILFEGGKADIIEVYGDESAESEETDSRDADEEETPRKRTKKALVGIDVIASPPGKKLDNIQALSGGERTLTSIALICAILHTNPPPFVVLDEVEAALDEANTLRFTKILRELSDKSQFILITHNRATMHAVDALYGVTIGGDGISHIVSMKMEGES